MVSLLTRVYKGSLPSYSLLHTFGCIFYFFLFPFLRDYIVFLLAIVTFITIFAAWIRKLTGSIFLTMSSFYKNNFPCASSTLHPLDGVDYITFDETSDCFLSSDTFSSSMT